MIQQPKVAAIDGDIIAYRLACKVDIFGDKYLIQNIQEYVAEWTPGDVDHVILTFSCNRADNFRKIYWPLYKEHRNVVAKPDSMSYVIDAMSEIYESFKKDIIEADDIMGKLASAGKAIAVTIDKDLRGVPGWHWNPDKEWEPRYITYDEADRFFCKQWIMGDSTDKVPGIPKVGPVKAERLLDTVEPHNREQLILAEYEKKGLSEEYALGQATAIRILRIGEKPVLWQPSWYV